MLLVDEDVEETPPRRQPWPWGPVVLVLLVVAVAAAAWALTRSAEPAFGTVPPVVRLAERDAAGRLGQAGFTVVVDRRRSDAARRGVVIEQRPSAGSELGTGAIVSVVVATGPATIAVPDVTGLAAARAAQVLRVAHLRAEPVQVFSRAPAGTVVAQSPRADERANWLAAVRITVSRGSARVTVPSVVGRSADAARAALRRAGLAARAARVRSAARAGAVVAQTPVGGSSVAAGDGVRIDVSDGGGPAESPPAENPHTPVVLGFGEAEAVAELERYGYRVLVRRRPTELTVEDGTVIGQNPAGGGPLGSVITLVVGDAAL